MKDFVKHKTYLRDLGIRRYRFKCWIAGYRRRKRRRKNQQKPSTVRPSSN